jgi:N-formylglutamate amidohydrolase
MYLSPSTIEIRRAQGEITPVIATIPHSGRWLPDSVAAAMHTRHSAWLKNTDWYLDLVYEFLPSLGITTILAPFSRYVCDVNRDPSASTPGPFFKSAIPIFTDTEEPVYIQPPDEDQAKERIRQFHAPFHAAVASQLQQSVASFGKTWLLDLHSFMGPGSHDICIGNAGGLSSSIPLLQSVAGKFEDQGFIVRCNEPFTGGYIVRRHANVPDVESLLIELRYPNYLNCDTIDEPMPPQLDPFRIQQVSIRLKAVFEHIAATARDA